MFDKKEYVMHMRNLKQTSNHGLVLKKVYRLIQFNQKVWLKPHINLRKGLRKKVICDFESDFFKLVNNAVYGKTMENVRKHRDNKFVTTEARRDYVVS